MPKTKGVSIFTLSIYITLLCNLGILIGNPLKIDWLVSLCTHILIISVVGFALLSFLKYINGQRVDKLIALAILVFAMAVVFSMRQGLSILLSKYVSILCFLMIPSYIVLFYNKTCTYKIKKTVYRIGFVYWLVFLYLSTTELSHIGYGAWGTFQYDCLTIGFQNPNEAGMMLFIPYVVLIAAFLDANRIYEKILSGVAVLHLLYLIIETQSRTCVILAVLIFVLWVLKLTSRMIRRWITFAFVLPFLTLLFQMMFPDLLDSIMVLGESIDTGRLWLWTSFVSNTSMLQWLFGNLANYGGANMHNSYLSVVAAYGIIGFIPYVVLLWKAYNYYYSNIDHTSKINTQKISFLGLLCVLLHGCAEGSFLVSGTVFAGLVSLLIILVLPEEGRP